MEDPSRRGVSLLLAIALVLSGLAFLATAQPVDRNTAPTYGRCVKPDQAPEIFGPTDVNAQSANGGLAVGLNEDATLTVLRYPRPSFYDQIKYHTTTRSEPRLGVAPNEGAFLGLVADTPSNRTTTWLRSWETTQRYAPQLAPSAGPGGHPFTDVVETRFHNASLGLTVTVQDVVAAPPTDVLARHVTVTRDPTSPVVDAKLVAFENLNLVVSKTPLFPTQDWCQEEENRDLARYLPTPDAIVHTKQGIDRSTGTERSVAIGMAWAGPSAGHQVGADAHEPAAAPIARTDTRFQDAYDDARDGHLNGNEGYHGQTTGALTRDLDLPARGQPALEEATLLIAGGDTADGVIQALDAARESSVKALAEEKERWIRERLDEAPMPDVPQDGDGSHANVTELARRALATLVTSVDRRSRAIVASIATQSPYGQDWIRDGAYFNLALDLIGLTDWTEEHNRWYANAQQRALDPRPSAVATPPGNWAMVYYADGVAGGPIPYEIDETGYGVWTLWRHYDVTGDLGYLRDVYPAIQRAGDHLVRCEDPTTGLQCIAWEDDNYVPGQSIIGAELAWLGLDAAARAANALGQVDDQARFQARQAELAHAIDAHLWDEEDEQYGTDTPLTDTARRFGPIVPNAAAPAELAWPVCYEPTAGSDRMVMHRRAVWDRTAPSFDEPTDANDRTQGLYESKTLLALAKWWKDRPGTGEALGMADVREGLRWVADWHATNDTRVMGEVWVQEGQDVESRVSMPHIWEQTLFYLASLEAWPPASVDPAVATTPSCGGVIDALTPGLSPAAS